MTLILISLCELLMLFYGPRKSAVMKPIFNLKNYPTISIDYTNINGELFETIKLPSISTHILCKHIIEDILVHVKFSMIFYIWHQIWIKDKVINFLLNYRTHQLEGVSGIYHIIQIYFRYIDMVMYGLSWYGTTVKWALLSMDWAASSERI